MEQKYVTVDDLAKGNLDTGVAYTIIKKNKVSLSSRIDDFLEKFKMDSYSRMCRKDDRNGVTNDLAYNNTLSKCSDTQYIKMIWVEGYTTFVNEYNKDVIDKDTERKIKKLLDDYKIGYILDDSYGCYVCCKRKDYAWLCTYLGVEYDTKDDDKEYYYNSLYDDLLQVFNDYCDVIPYNRNYKADILVHEIARFILVNLDKYTDYFIGAREYNKDNEDDYWVNRLWIAACRDCMSK